jgi:hypothetical protein
MLLSLLLIFAISLGGLALTYLVADDEPFMWRLAAGNVIGSAIFGTLGFVLASVFGLNVGVVIVMLSITMMPLALLYKNRQIRRTFVHDWAKAKGTLQGANLKKFRHFAFYAFFLLVFISFFGRAMFENAHGIFTGGSNNLGDLPFHLGAIFSFTDGNNFPPQNPSFAGAKFSYPFVADFVTACFVLLGIGVSDAMFVQNISWAFSLLVILERFVWKLTGDKLAGRIAPALLFFSGGLGFIWFFGDYWAQDKSIFTFLWNLPKDYTIGNEIFRWGDWTAVLRWGNSLITLFITQRGLLLGMPLTLIVLSYLWGIFNAETQRGEGEKGRHGDTEKKIAASPPALSASLLVGVLAGLLPLIHLHSLAVLFVVGIFVFALRPDKWREWLMFAAGVAVVAVPELIWSILGSATKTNEFFGWHYGWHKGDTDVFWFWLKNTGLVIPLLGAGIYLAWLRSRPERSGTAHHGRTAVYQLYFFLPFAALFIVSNVAKLAPWEWDNIKVLIYWYVGSIPFIAIAIAWMWRKDKWMKVAAGVCFVILTASGMLDVWRTASGQINYKVFDKDAIAISEGIKKTTEPTALFLNAPTYNTAAVLSGRRSLMRYSGHLSSHGIDYGERERDVKTMYQGGPAADALLAKYDIQYVLISPEEKSSVSPNEAFYRKFPVVAEAGQYKVYKVK